MASSPRWKVYTADGEYVASFKHVEDAASLVAFRGEGTMISDGHTKVVWTEGAEDQPAGDSYDHVVDVVFERAGLNREMYAECWTCVANAADQTGHFTVQRPFVLTGKEGIELHRAAGHNVKETGRA